MKEKLFKTVKKTRELPMVNSNYNNKNNYFEIFKKIKE